MVGYIKAVFHKVGCKAQHFFAGIDECAQKGVEHTSSAAAQQHIIGGEVYALLLAEVGGQFFARPDKAAVGHVAKSKRFASVFCEGTQTVHNGGGGWQVGVA